MKKQKIIYGVDSENPRMWKTQWFKTLEEAREYVPILENKIKSSWCPKSKAVLVKGVYSGKIFSIKKA